jgi:hypothetical protein
MKRLQKKQSKKEAIDQEQSLEKAIANHVIHDMKSDLIPELFDLLVGEIPSNYHVYPENDIAKRLVERRPIKLQCL